MGKRYYCDYCDKSMVATPSIIRIHNNGAVHQKLVNEHYQQFKDPALILHEESQKKPCTRFATGECRFGAICHFSHYTEEQINELKQCVEFREKSKILLNLPSFEDLYKKMQTDRTAKPQPSDSTTIYDSNGVCHVFPWVYNRNFEQCQDKLPPSLKQFKIDDFKEVSFTEWG